jgi:hypothetical protein
MTLRGIGKVADACKGGREGAKVQEARGISLGQPHFIMANGGTGDEEKEVGGYLGG